MRDKLVVGWTAAKSKFVAQSRPALYYSQQQVEHARWETRNSQVEGFCIKYIVAAFSSIGDIRDTAFCFSYFGVLRTQRKIFILFCSARYVVYQ